MNFPDSVLDFLKDYSLYTRRKKKKNNFQSIVNIEETKKIKYGTNYLRK